MEIVQDAQEQDAQEGDRREDWGVLWNHLAWDRTDPDFGGRVALWGILMVEGERAKYFLTEGGDLSGEGPSNVFGTPLPCLRRPSFQAASGSLGTNGFPGMSGFLEMNGFLGTSGLQGRNGAGVT